MCSKETFEIIAKITLILSNLMWTVNKDYHVIQLIHKFEKDFEEACYDEVFLNFETYLNKLNPLTDLEYVYAPDLLKIHYKDSILDDLLLLPDIYVDDFIPFLKEKHPELYDIVWLNWNNPEYDVKFNLQNEDDNNDD